LNLRLASGVGLAVAASVGVTLWGSAVAHAGSPNVVGQKYSDAQSALSSAGYTAVISVTQGDRIDRADCIVTNQNDHNAQPPPNSGGSGTKQTLLTLNCYAQVATYKDPGNSLASPEGRAAAASAAAAAASSSEAAAAAASGSSGG
jgi:hypothetical protein